MCGDKYVGISTSMVGSVVLVQYLSNLLLRMWCRCPFRVGFGRSEHSIIAKEVKRLERDI